MKFQSRLYKEDIDRVSGITLDWKTLEGKKILISGASGMIGTFLIDVLMQRNLAFENKITIFAMSRNRKKLEFRFREYMDQSCFRLIEQDITEKIVLEEQVDYIVHAASNTHPKEYSNDPIGTITTNILGTYNLLEYAKNVSGCRVILLSSVEIYGENKGDVDKFSETDFGFIDCNTLRAGYPESKRLSEAMLQAYRSQENVDSISIRLCRTYGPTVEKDDSKALSQFIERAVKRENIVLKSEGRQLFSYIYTADAVSAILWIMLNGISGEAYNVADSKSDITLKELAETLAKEAGTNVIFELPDEKERKGYSTATKALLDATKLKMLGWKPRYSIQEGLERTIKILREE